MVNTVVGNGKAMTSAERERLTAEAVRLRRAGEQVDTIAATLGINPSTAGRWLRDSGQFPRATAPPGDALTDATEVCEAGRHVLRDSDDAPTEHLVWRRDGMHPDGRIRWRRGCGRCRDW